MLKGEHYKMKRNKFNLSNEHKLTCDMGELIPLQCVPVLPGDTFRGSSAVLLRTTPLNAPVMHPVIARIHHWFVPNRLVWSTWPDFITGGEDGLDAQVPPFIAMGSASEGTLADYLGLPIDTYGGTLNVDAMPFRAYSLIFNEFYRDQQLVTERVIDTTDGQDTTTDVTLANCAWEKDYFTTLRPDTKLGDDITIPFSVNDTAPVTGIGMYDGTYAVSNRDVYETDGTGTVQYATSKLIDSAVNGQKVYVEQDPDNSGYPNIRADLEGAAGIDIGDLRLAIAMQRFQERHNVYGARYSEYLKYLGVRNDLDARLQRPEYLGGGKSIIQFSEVLATDGSNTGAMKGHGISAMRTNAFQKFFAEHGFVMTLMSVLPRTIYMNGVKRKWLKATKEEYYQREFASIGDQTITNKEVYAAHGTPDGTFGYGPRYDEYRSEQGNISGELGSTLNHWQLARDFGSNPALNSTFVTATPTKRHLQSTGTDGLIISSFNSLAARRMVTKRAGFKIF